MSDSDFETTVKQLAASPTKLAMLGKVAGSEDVYRSIVDILQSGMRPDATRKLHNVMASGALMGFTSAGGMVLKELIEDVVSGGKDTQESKKEMGKLRGRESFMSERVEKLRPIQRDVFHHVITSDDMLQDADQDQLRSSFTTMRRFAPSLAADPNAVRSFLRESVMYGAGPNYASLKNLADAERVVAETGVLM